MLLSMMFGERQEGVNIIAQHIRLRVDHGVMHVRLVETAFDSVYSDRPIFSGKGPQ